MIYRGDINLSFLGYLYFDGHSGGIGSAHRIADAKDDKQ
jgi:hypothetical protein